MTLLRARAEILVQRGDLDQATADLVRMFGGSKESQPRWFVAGTWVVGPYPIDRTKVDSDLARSLPPESNPDPARPVMGPEGKGTLAWKPVVPAADGLLDLSSLAEPKDWVSTYVLVRVYAPEERDVVAMVANDDWLRLWCNGELILAQPLSYDLHVPIPIHLHAGWNTLLAKVSNAAQGYALSLKLTSDLEEIARAFGNWVDKKGWSDQAADRLERLYRLVPDRQGSWDEKAGPLAAEVARREGLFRRVLASRPKDHLLLTERGRYLAWLGKWDEALAAYDAMIHDRTDSEDAFVEYASILLLKGDVAAYRKWSGELVERFGKSGGPSAGAMLALAFGLTPDASTDPARLVPWAEKAVAKQPRSAAYLHSLGLAQFRSGHPDRAVKAFQASIEAREEGARNWYGLALAYVGSGQVKEAGLWFEKAEAWMVQKEPESADRTNHPTPPVSITTWLEALVLRREALPLLGNRRLGDITLVDRTAPAGQEFRLPLGLVELRHDPLRNGAPGSFRVVAPFRTKSPVADGKIEPDEYGLPLTIDFTDDKNPGATSPTRRTRPRARATSPPSSTWPIPGPTCSSPSKCATTS